MTRARSSAAMDASFGASITRVASQVHSVDGKWSKAGWDGGRM
jgi:hypothetical protein